MKAPNITFQLSIRSVRLHFLRSVLAALGIVIGVVAIASMGMMGANMTLSVTANLASMGNILVVTPYSGGNAFFGGGPGPGTFVSTRSSEEEDYISQDQYEDILRTASDYGLVYALYSNRREEITIGSNQARVGVYGMPEDVMRQVLTVTEGDYPSGASTVLVGPQLAERLNLQVGNRIKVGTEDEGQSTVRVAGILKERGMSTDFSSDNAIIVTDEWYENKYGSEGEYPQVNIVLDDINDVSAAEDAITSLLNRKEDVVTVSDSSSRLETITSTLGTMTGFVMSIAGISLVVAAVSIFNVMMMSVTERIREIGILRSIGTQKGEIRRMFIYESVILGFVGAGIGAVASIAIGYLVVLAMVGSTDYFFTAESLVYVPLAMLVGVVVCVCSGVYPAWRASNLDPIEALRAE
ncbi:MAG TPA: ABC transporter permease [Methanomicrobiales archaeon]|nr:ABC transporter permease [Methanomicrobiales archaeon]